MVERGVAGVRAPIRTCTRDPAEDSRGAAGDVPGRSYRVSGGSQCSSRVGPPAGGPITGGRAGALRRRGAYFRGLTFERSQRLISLRMRLSSMTLEASAFSTTTSMYSEPSVLW